MKKETYPKDKIQMDKEDITDYETWFEEFCGCCYNFPGDTVVTETSCPFLKMFEEKKFSSQTNWKEIGCDSFYD